MSQAPFPARQCQGEGTPRRESWATAGGDRRGWAGGRQGGRDSGSSRGGRGKDRQPAAWPHCPPALPGVSPHRLSAVSAPLQPPRGTPPPAFPHTQGTTVCDQLHLGAGRGEHFSSGRYGNEPPQLIRTWYPGQRHGGHGRGMLSLLPHHPQPGCSPGEGGMLGQTCVSSS